MTAAGKHIGHCAFCWHATVYGPGGDGVRIAVRRDDDTGFQQDLFAHIFCLTGRLHPGIPFELALFGSDWAEAERRLTVKGDRPGGERTG